MQVQALSRVYRPRQPKLTSFYRVIEEVFERFEQVYPERYEQEYGLPKRLRVYFKYDRRLPGSGPGQALDWKGEVVYDYDFFDALVN